MVTLQMVTNECVGVKHDGGKPRLDLLPWGAVLACAETLTYGAQKYGEGNWSRVPNGRTRYLAAALRHVIAFAQGEWLDAESGLPHLAHALTSLMFLYELASKEDAK
jgi:hypothetical protein